jgi:hypothetical protein
MHFFVFMYDSVYAKKFVDIVEKSSFLDFYSIAQYDMKLFYSQIYTVLH